MSLNHSQIHRSRHENIIHQLSCLVLGPWRLLYSEQSELSEHSRSTDRLGVTQHTSHYHRWDSMREHNRRSRVPAVMQPYHRQAGQFDKSWQALYSKYPKVPDPSS